MSRDLAARHGFKIFPTVREALTLGEGSIAVDAVVFAGEHGNYPTNDVGQKQYPRYELFNQILDVYESSGKAVPTFFDKHLSYSWQKAKSIYDRAAKLKVPWLAGSSVPLTVRDPVLEYPQGTRLQVGIANEIIVVEVSRTLDNFGITTRPPDELRAQIREIADRNLAHLDLIPLDKTVLKRAGSGFPTPVGTLDAIHLATALLWAENNATPLTLLTHDRQLATAARACGLPVYPV